MGPKLLFVHASEVWAPVLQVVCNGLVLDL